jgi:glutamine amidotransferase-like uncharacterized protein
MFQIKTILRSIFVIATMIVAYGCVGSIQAQVVVAPGNTGGLRVAYTIGNISLYQAAAPGVQFIQVSPTQIRNGDLITNQYDVFLMPGGSADNQFTYLGLDGMTKIQEYVNAGGAYAGINAGAYLASWGVAKAGYQRMGLANIEIEGSLDGIGNVEIQMAGGASTVFTSGQYTSGVRDIFHYNGPMWITGTPPIPGRPPVTIVAQYTGNGTTTVTPGSGFVGRISMLYDMYGSGCVFLSADHPEFVTTLGNAAMIPEMLNYLATCSPMGAPAPTGRLGGQGVLPGAGIVVTDTPTPTPTPTTPVARNGYIHPGIDIKPAGSVSNTTYVYSTHAGFITYAGPAPAPVREKGWMVQVESDLNRDNVPDVITRYNHLFPDTLMFNDFRYKRILFTPSCFTNIPGCPGIKPLPGTGPYEKLPYGYGPYVARNQQLGIAGDSGSLGERHLQYEIITNRFLNTSNVTLNTYSCLDDPYIEACTSDPSRPGFFFPINRPKDSLVRGPVYYNSGFVTPPPAPVNQPQSGVVPTPGP